MELSHAFRIWNRAALEGGGAAPRDGDRALAALLAVHGMIMNGGVDHAFEALSRAEIAEGAKGFSYFGLEQVAELLEQALRLEVGIYESFNTKYWALVPADSTLQHAFESMHRQHPSRFSPLGGDE